MKWSIKVLILINIQIVFLSGSLLSQNSTLNYNALSFSEAAEYISLYSYTLSRYDKAVKQKEQELKAARGLYLPRVGLSANYIFMSDDIHMDLTPVKDAITPLYETMGNYGVFSGVPNPDPTTNSVMPVLPDNISTSAVRGKMLEGLNEINSSEWNRVLQKREFGTVNANFVMPIYTGGKINAANKAARIEKDEAQLQMELKHDELFCELTERYYGLVLSQRALEVRKTVLAAMENHLNDATKLKQQGMIAEAEFLHAKVYYSEAEREYKKAMNANTIVNRSLLTTLSVDTVVNVLPVSNLFYTQSVSPIEYYTQSAQQNSKMIEMVKHKKQLARQGYKAEFANYIPTVAAMGTYDIANKDLSEMVPEYVVGIGVSWTVFDGAARYRNVKAAKLRESQADDYLLQTELDINMAIQKYYSELTNALEQLHDLETAEQFANEYYRVRNKAFSEGMATTTEVADANLALAKVKIDRLQAAYNFDVSLAKLLFYSGSMNEFGQYQTASGVMFCE